ncbi:CPBP family intramembrane glutamic endopeptidase [Anthocerotibacter panamensis]|uniref:CPBP family intramembrane glutamic endopeptidase n=1 Tax=Anthocerotibacter panamensis TaxID=2857077 RepID=UPI001C40404D|nr:type II CAAX endopeptidase family protein [Anthocerotibacter panamensis]
MQRTNFVVVWTILIASLILTSLLGSFLQPARQKSLALTTEDLQLQLLWLKDDPEYGSLVQKLLPEDPIAATRDRYREGYQEAGAKEDLTDLRLKLGLLAAKSGQTQQALALWAKAGTPGQVLTGLYGQPPHLLPNSEAILRKALQGWYQQEGLTDLYRLQGQALPGRKAAQQELARHTLFRLVGVNGFQVVATLLGLVLLIREGWLWAAKKRTWKQSWSVPWTLTDATLVVVGWLTASFMLAFVLRDFGTPLLDRLIPAPDLKLAVFVFLSKALDTLVALALFGWWIGRAHPRAEILRLRVQGLSWGVGAYLAVLPLVWSAALLTQGLVKGGGGNPLLSVIQQSQNPWAGVLLFVTVALLAPISEELLFRGLLFSGFTTVMSAPWAMVASGFIFGAIHQSAAEFLPLSVLGIVLAYSYYRTRNLAVPLLLHICFNSVTFGTLLLLGGA